MIEELYTEEEGRIGTISEKINEMIDAINKMENHYHSHGEMTGNTGYPTYNEEGET